MSEFSKGVLLAISQLDFVHDMHALSGRFRASSPHRPWMSHWQERDLEIELDSDLLDADFERLADEADALGYSKSMSGRSAIENLMCELLEEAVISAWPGVRALEYRDLFFPAAGNEGNPSQ